MSGLLPVANVLGRLMMLFSISYVIPIAGSLFWLDGMASDFSLGMAITMGSSARRVTMNPISSVEAPISAAYSVKNGFAMPVMAKNSPPPTIPKRA